MNEKILIWITNAYANFGLAKSLKKKYDCKIFGVSNADGYASEYLKNQDLVKFEKIWFCPDSLKDIKEKPDIDYLENFEKKYRVNLWKIIYGDRRLVTENQRYYKYTRKDHLHIIEQTCKFLEEVLKKSNPDFLIVNNPVYHYDHLLFLMSKALGIKVILLRKPNIGSKIVLSENMVQFDEIDTKGQKYSKDKTFEEIRNYFKKHSILKQIDDRKPNFKVSKIEKIKAFLEFIFTSNSSNKQYINYGKTRLSIIKQGLGIKHRLRKNLIKSFMDSNFLLEIKDESFIYFPFHKEPERNLDIGSPYFTDQKSVAKIVAKSLPINFKLYVKDHPAQFTLTTMWKRSREYYQELLDLPNVEIIHPSVNSENIFKKCSLVVSINGSSALEAAAYGKSSIILTTTDFTDLPSVLKIDSLNEFPQKIRNALSTKIDRISLSEFIDKLDKNSYRIDVNKIRIDFNNKFPYPGFLKWPKHSPKKVKEFLDGNQKIFDDLSDLYIKKMFNHKRKDV